MGDPNNEEESLQVGQMVMIFLNAIIFIKIPMLIFGFRMSEDPTAFNIGGFVVCVAFSIFTMLRFIFRKNKKK
jgi:K+ transporter